MVTVFLLKALEIVPFPNNQSTEIKPSFNPTQVKRNATISIKVIILKIVLNFLILVSFRNNKPTLII